MAEVLVKFTEPVLGSDGRMYDAQACGDVADDGLWEGWIEFTVTGASSTVRTVRTERETEQPNFTDLQYWSQGLSMAYLQGALARALHLPVVTTAGNANAPSAPDAAPEFELRGGPGLRVVGARPALNPFLVYAEGEEFLRGQLLGLSREELATIVTWYNLPVSVDVQCAAPSAIVDDIARTLHDARRPARKVQERRAG
jgi:hypothetical protein